MIDFKRWIDFGLIQGADEIEFYLERIKSTKIQVFNGDVESLLSSTSHGLGIRVFSDGKLGFAYTTNLNDTELKRVVSDAIRNAKLTQISVNQKLPHSDNKDHELKIFESQFADAKLEEKIDFGIALEKVALEYDSKIVRVPLATYEDEDKEIFIANSNGLNKNYRKTTVQAILTALAFKCEENQTGLGIGFGRKISDLNAQMIGENAARQAISLLGATVVPTQKVPSLFSPYTASLLFAPFMSGFLAERVHKNRSLYQGKLGEQIASPLVTLIDDGLKKEGFQVSSFDDEGMPSQRTVVVEKGVLKNYLYDFNSAKKDGVNSTGNARRQNYKEFPNSALTNFYLQPGNHTVEEMISGTCEGFYVLNLTGVGSGTNPISGDFSVGAVGIWIKDGKLSHPVRGVTISGNFIDMLNDIIQIGNDLTFNFVTKFMGMPSILVRKLMVTGS